MLNSKCVHKWHKVTDHYYYCYSRNGSTKDALVLMHISQMVDSIRVNLAVRVRANFLRRLHDLNKLHSFTI